MSPCFMSPPMPPPMSPDLSHSVEAAVREALYLGEFTAAQFMSDPLAADKLSPFVTLNTPDDTQPQLPGMVGMPNTM